MIDQATGLLKRRMFSAFVYSLKGLRACFRHEEAFRVEVALAAVLIPLGLVMGQTGLERVVLIGSVLLVLIVELLNSAIESAIDRIGLERSELSGRAKDQGSAAVLLSLAIVILSWTLVLAG